MSVFAYYFEVHSINLVDLDSVFAYYFCALNEFGRFGLGEMSVFAYYFVR